MRTKFSIVFRCLGAVALLAFAAGLTPQPASAQTCLQDEWSAAGNHQKLNCTANDVRVAKVTNIRDPLTGATLTKCLQGSTFSFIADFEIVTSSTSSRSNIGLYFATQNQGTALTGSCVDNIISPIHNCPGVAGGPTIQCGSDNYHELDTSTPTDSCGDTSSTDNSPVFGGAAEGVTIQVDGFKCEAPAGSDHLVLPNCTSWQIPGGTLLCVSNPPSYPYQTTAIPGTPSKCNCGVIDLPIQPVTASATVAKSCNTALTTATNPSPTTCDAGPEGSPVTYHVATTNTSSFGEIIVDKICDDQYGTIFNQTNSACVAGAVCISQCTGVNTPFQGCTGSKTASPGTSCITSTTCSALDILQNATGTCDFTAVEGENGSVTDTASVSGHSKVNTTSTFGPTKSNSVLVTSTDAPSTATVTKGFDSNTNACVTVRYTVDVKNTSKADEALTLSGLNDDKFGSITTTHGTAGTNNSVLGTTCGVSAGIGTLLGTTGAGTFPATLAVAGTDYTCKFDGVICDVPGTITIPGDGTCTGIQHTNTVSGNTLLGDEGESVTETDHSLTVSQCITTTATSN